MPTQAFLPSSSVPHVCTFEMSSISTPSSLPDYSMSVFSPTPSTSTHPPTTYKAKYKSAHCSFDTISIPRYSCGTMTSECPTCKGLHFHGEKNTRGFYSHCCHAGHVNLPPPGDYPPYLKSLITGTDEDANHFLTNIRSYNSALSFASMHAAPETPSTGPTGFGPKLYRIHGALQHSTYNIPPEDYSKHRKFAQIYVLDAQKALLERTNNPYNDKCQAHILEKLDNEIRAINPFAQAFHMMKEVERELIETEGSHAVANLRMYITDAQSTPGIHKGRLNVPTCNEVAMVFVDEDGGVPTNRGIVIFPKRSDKVNIRILNPNCDPMSYVIFFPRGDKGHSVDQNITHLQFYSFRLTQRVGEFNPIFYGGLLFQQYLVDAFCKVEGTRLEFVVKNQKKLRSETYQGLIDYVNKRAANQGLKAGIPVILPSTFSCSPRAMTQLYHDAMAVVRLHGKPDLFITVTCNPKCDDIKAHLPPGQKASNRPDLLTRVFGLHNKDILNDITKTEIFGKVETWIYVIEFQKRGLPHMHLLLWLAEQDKIKDADKINLICCAEIPDPDADPELYETVKATMIHGPCGILNRFCPCMVDGKCSKGYPKEFCPETVESVNGYPKYRRRENGRTVRIRGHDLDNRWVVPYNAYLTKRFNCHINVEVCSSIKSVKYIFKYIYKGFDCANVQLETSSPSTQGTLEWNEVKTYLAARYLSAPEAAWRLNEKLMHDKYNTVFRLPVHLPMNQNVYFVDNEEERALEAAAVKLSQLSAFFILNGTQNDANQYLYTEIPMHYVWNKNAWKKRVMYSNKIITRMYAVNPRDTERFHLRMLLNHVRGPKCFEDVRTFEGVLYPTFKDACLARGLLQNDHEWFATLTEASIYQMPKQLRQLFVTICIFCNPVSPLRLWEEYVQFFIEDFLQHDSEEISKQKALHHIKHLLSIHNMSMADYQLPEPSRNDFSYVEQIYNQEFERSEGQRVYNLLNEGQKNIFDTIMESISSPPDKIVQRLFCINASGGTGKSFLINAILNAVRGQGKIAVACAWTGIASTLLKGGRTVHSTFKLPVPVDENSTCKLKWDSLETKQLRAAAIVVCDELTMMPQPAFDAINRGLQDICRNNVPFGGKVFLVCGDFRQLLPIAFHGNRTKIVQLCVKNSLVWGQFKQLTLETNMRALQSEKVFANWLLQVGDGKLLNNDNLPDDIIEIPSQCIVKKSIIDDVYGNDFNKTYSEASNRAILSPTNESCFKLNEEVLSRIPGPPTTYYSADTVIADEDEDISLYTSEFLNSLTPTGMPPHKLNLKVGAMVMLLRNLDSSNGLCNGSRLIIRRLLKNVLDAEIIYGEHKGKRYLLPRIQLTPSDADMPFKMSRRQFPIRLAYSFSITKSQGQSLDKVGIYLPAPVFSHGMLYVAFSRATKLESVKVLIEDGQNQGKLVPNSTKVFTKNVVYKEVFTM